MRLLTFGKPRVISCAEDHPLYIGLPRGCLDELLRLLSELNIESVVRDERNPGRPLAVSFHGQLRHTQQLAADALAAHDTGVLAATTAFGKTVVAAWLIARRGVSTPDPGAPPAIDGTVDGASVNFSGIVDQGHRSDWRWEKQAQRNPGRGPDTEPRPQGRGQ